jgi:antitoxin VapB
MPLNIKNSEVERLVEERTRLTKETKTEAIRKALQERKVRLQLTDGLITDRSARAKNCLERKVWRLIPPELRRKGISKRERESVFTHRHSGRLTSG